MSMSVPLLPESAPFTPAQRAWLNGFFAGVFGLQTEGNGNGAGVPLSSMALAASAMATTAAMATATAPTTAPNGVAMTTVVARPTSNRSHPFPARLIACQPLNRPGSEKDTRHVRISLDGSGLTYKPGDALGVYPENCPELVDE